MASPNIFTQYLRPVKSVAEFRDEADQRDMRRLEMDTARQRNALQSLAMQQQAESSNALRQIASGWNANTTPQERIASLRNAGRPELMTQADALEKADLDRQKTESDSRAKQAEVLTKVLAAQGDLASRVMANPTREAAAAAVANMKALTQSLGVQLDFSADEAAVMQFQSPEDVKRWAAGHALKASELLPKVQQYSVGNAQVTQAVDPLTGAPKETGRVAIQQSPDSIASNATQRRGQDMTDARARERLQFDQSQPRGQFLETPTGYVLGDPRSGSVAPVMGPDGKQVQGKAADRALTDSQAKANLFGSRMQEADRIITSLEGKYSPVAVNAKMSAENVPLIGGAAGWAGNAMLSTEGQQAEQAQRDFINAVLRRESGAVISPSEFANGQKQYFPQPGDGPEVLAQKRRNRQIAIEGLMAEVPQAKRGTPTLTSPGGQSGATGEWTYVGPAGGR